MVVVVFGIEVMKYESSFARTTLALYRDLGAMSYKLHRESNMSCKQGRATIDRRHRVEHELVRSGETLIERHSGNRGLRPRRFRASGDVEMKQAGHCEIG